MLLASWLNPQATDQYSSTFEVVPLRIGRLEQPRYGAEHLLICATPEPGGSMLPLSLDWDDGQRLEQELERGSAGGAGGGGGIFGTAALRASLVLRKGRFLSAARCAAADPLAGEDLSAVMLRSLAEAGLEPKQVALARPGGAGAVRYRDMKANTPAAPSGVALLPPEARLYCREGSGRTRILPLDGAGEAVALARRAGMPVEVAHPPLSLPRWRAHNVVTELCGCRCRARCGRRTLSQRRRRCPSCEQRRPCRRSSHRPQTECDYRPGMRARRNIRLTWGCT